MTETTIPAAIERFIESLPREGWRLDGPMLRCGCSCPLTVAAGRHAKYAACCYAETGLSAREATMVIAAADDYECDSARAIRARLLEHCGLEEAK